MRVATVNASDLGDRWDAPFHVAQARSAATRHSLREEADRLRATWSAGDAVATLERFDLEILAAVGDLARGDGRDRKASIGRAIREYPHLALAMVLREAPTVVAVIGLRISTERAKLDAILSLAGTAGPLPGHVYPLRDPTRFDDADGAGYGFVLFDGDPVPGKRLQWGRVCDGDLEVHPGFPDAIQVAPSDVDLSRGRPATPTAVPAAPR